MRIGILGTGTVGRSLAEGFAGVGHHVTIGTRDPAQTSRRDDFAAWHAHHDIPLETFPTAAAGSELVVNAGQGAVSLTIVESAGPANLDGKILVDVANPLDFSQGFPPTLTVKDTDSLAEQLQRAAPGARVVKTLNTVTAAVMINPAQVGGGDTTVFMAGDDADAKTTVRDLLRQLGWENVLDLGDLTAARGLEMWLPLWVRIMSAVGSPMFNLKIVQ